MIQLPIGTDEADVFTPVFLAGPKIRDLRVNPCGIHSITFLKNTSVFVSFTTSNPSFS